MTNLNLKTIVITIAILSFLWLNTGFASTLWEYGVEDLSSDEYVQHSSAFYTDELLVPFGEVSNENPGSVEGMLPGYLYTKSPTADYEHVTTFTTATLSFEFDLIADYVQLDLFYGRFGSEIDDIYFDDILIASVDGTEEGVYDLFEVAITDQILGGTILAGTHTLSITYSGGDAATGHYIDFLRLKNGIPLIPNPEPATLVLLGFGLLGLAGVGRKKFN